MKKNALEQLLNLLPPVKTDPICGVYGCRSLLAEYCGFREPPWQGDLINSGGNWQHGWHPPSHNFHPEVVVGTDGQSGLYKDRIPIYVAREDQRKYLNLNGYRLVHAIGMPIVYSKSTTIDRIPKSLLVMPSHSSDESKHIWDFREFARNLSKVLDRYEFVAACIHPACLRKGFWIKELAELGIPIIDGATITDRNAISRIRILLSAFSDVICNGFGSHLAYAEYNGAKVTLIPPWPVETIDDYERVGFHTLADDVLQKLIDLTQEDSVRHEFPLFFETNKAYGWKWASFQLGENQSCDCPGR